MGLAGLRHASASSPWERQSVSTVQEAGWVPRPIWTGAQNIAPAGIRSPNRPTLSKSSYQLRYIVGPSVNVRYYKMSLSSEFPVSYSGSAAERPAVLRNLRFLAVECDWGELRQS